MAECTVQLMYEMSLMSILSRVMSPVTCGAGVVTILTAISNCRYLCHCCHHTVPTVIASFTTVINVTTIVTSIIVPKLMSVPSQLWYTIIETCIPYALGVVGSVRLYLVKVLQVGLNIATALTASG